MSKQGSRQGIYSLHQIVKGKESWKSGSNAIWYVPGLKKWLFGSLNDIGTTGASITGDEVGKGLFTIPNNKWGYYNNGWKDVNSGDVIIKCVVDSGTLFSNLVDCYLVIKHLFSQQKYFIGRKTHI